MRSWFLFVITISCCQSFVTIPNMYSDLTLLPNSHRSQVWSNYGVVINIQTNRCGPSALRAALLVDSQNTVTKNSIDSIRDQIEKRLQTLKEEDKFEREPVSQEFDSMKTQGTIKLWRSVPTTFRRASLGELRMLTRGVIKEGSIDVNGQSDMEVINVSFYSTLVSSMILSTLAASYLPDMDLPMMRGAVFRYLASFSLGSIPFAFLGLGLSLPGLLQAGLIQARRAIGGEFRERLIRHEAGHFLVGYLMGLPIDSYRADDAILNAVQFLEDKTSLAGRVTHEEVDRLCAVSMAGVVAESIKFGDGIGGFADMSQLQVFLSRATPVLKDREQQDKVRWGCVAAYTAVKNHGAAYEALVEAMAAGRSVPHCIAAMELAHSDAQRL